MFAPHNLIRDAPFTKLDLITCRNLLIYFQPHAQKTVLTLFHFALKTGGFLFLGSSESPGGLLDEFDTIDEHGKIYRKRRDIGLPRDLKLPLPRSGTLPRAVPAPVGAQHRRQPAAARHLRPAARSLHAARAFWSTSTGSWSTCSAASSAAQGQGAAADAEPARHARRRSPDGRLRRAASRAHGCRKRHAIRRLHDAGLPAAISLVAEPLRDAHGAQTHVLISLADADGADAAGCWSPPFADVPARALEPARRPSAVDLGGLSRDQHARARGRALVHEGEPAGDDRGARDRERGAAGDQRGAGRLERGAAEHERGAALGQRGALHGQRRVPEEERRAAGAQRRHRAPAERHRRRHDVPRSATCASASSRRASPRPSRSSRTTSAGRSQLLARPGASDA